MLNKCSEEVNTKELVMECRNSRIIIFGSPWTLWSTKLMQSIDEQCGGLLDIRKDTMLFKDLSATKIKVKGPEDGFISSSR